MESGGDYNALLHCSLQTTWYGIQLC
jgi:hypothetical protein